jgi:release factor glutamine methyltransferase
VSEAAVAPLLHEGVRIGEGRLRAAGIESSRLDAELLMASVLGVGRERMVLDRLEPVGLEAWERFQELVARRVAHEPVAYILGRREFRRITLAVDRRVLIPRPETELLVEVGLELPSGAAVVDVGTGSGAVALALKSEREDLVVSGTDVSADAVAVARFNAGALGLDVQFVVGDLLAGLKCDAVLANLPYVPDGESLPADVAEYEPRVALFAGADGLGVIRRLVRQLDGVSVVALEHGLSQGDAVSQLLAAGGFRFVERLRDLAGHERVAVGRR